MSGKGKRIWNLVTTVLLILVVGLAILLAGVRLVGLTPFAVLSGSMEPEYPTGSLIYVQQAEAEDIKVGDPITFVMNEDLQVATHRVVEIDEENGRFTTKGDANEEADASPVLFENLIGKPVFAIPYLGYISSFLTNPPGMYIGWCAIAVVLLMMFAPELMKLADKSDKKAAEKKKAAGVQSGESQEAFEINDTQCDTQDGPGRQEKTP